MFSFSVKCHFLSVKNPHTWRTKNIIIRLPHMYVILSNLSIFPTDLVDYFTYAIYAVFSVLVISRFKLDKKKILWQVLMCVIAYAIFFAVDVIVNLIGKPINGEKVDEIIMYVSRLLCPIITSTAMILLIKDNRLFSRIIKSSVLLTTWLFSPSVAFIVTNYVIKGLPMNMVTMFVVRLLIAGGLFVLVFFYDIDKYRRIDIWALLMFEFFIIIQLVVNTVAQFSFNLDILNIASFIVWGLQFFVYVYFYLFVKNFNERNEVEMENEKLRNEFKLMDITRDNYESMQMLRHDIKKQYSYIAMLYEQGKDEEAKKFFSEVSLAANETLNFPATGNSVLDLTLNMVITKTKKDKIAFDYVCACPQELRFNDSDLFSLLINIFDNAVEGTLRNKTRERKIVARINTKDNYLFIDVINTIDENYRGDVSTSKKKNKKRHGYGKKIIKKICKEYDGDVIFSHNEDHYEVKAMLALVGEKDIKTENNNETRAS